MSSHISVLAGLGNPGPDYAGHRHNIGFWLADELARRSGAQFSEEKKFKALVAQAQLAGRKLWLVKPLTFMNRSGEALQPLLNFFRIPPEELLVVHDELDLSPGTLRLKRGGGHGGHNGLRDISRVMGADYARLRMGIGHPGSKERVHGHVLSNPSKEDAPILAASVDAAARAVEAIFADGWDKAVQTLHTDKNP